MLVCVTGCGPSLNKDHVPENTFIIGVNRSYELIEPHIICTIDYIARRAIMLSVKRKEPIYYGPHMLNDIPMGLELHTSGAFAIWVATLFNPTCIYLTGFGGKGHFYPGPKFNLLTEQIQIDRNELALKSILSHIMCSVEQF